MIKKEVRGFWMSKYLGFKQLFDVVKMHFYVSLVALFMGVIGMPVATGDVSKYIFSGVFVFIYALAMYSKGNDIAVRDKKSYTTEVPYFWKGALLPVGIFVIWGFLYALYFVTWKYDIIVYNSGFINNMLFLLWNSVYSGFLNLRSGNFDVAGVVMFFLIPVVTCGLGYFAGYRSFDIGIKVSKLIYEKQDKDEDDKGQEGEKNV